MCNFLGCVGDFVETGPATIGTVNFRHQRETSFVVEIVVLAQKCGLKQDFDMCFHIQWTSFHLNQEKGLGNVRWEELPTTPECPALCPWSVLQHYVRLTAGLVPPGSQVFISLQPPFKALSANSLGSVTKKLLQKYGISPE